MNPQKLGGQQQLLLLLYLSLKQVEVVYLNPRKLGGQQQPLLLLRLSLKQVEVALVFQLLINSDFSLCDI